MWKAALLMRELDLLGPLCILCRRPPVYNSEKLRAPRRKWDARKSTSRQKGIVLHFSHDRWTVGLSLCKLIGGLSWFAFVTRQVSYRTLTSSRCFKDCIANAFVFVGAVEVPLCLSRKSCAPPGAKAIFIFSWDPRSWRTLLPIHSECLPFGKSFQRLRVDKMMYVFKSCFNGFLFVSALWNIILDDPWRQIFLNCFFWSFFVK